MKYPCQGCEERHQACHSHCKKYIEADRQIKAAKKEAQRGKEADAYLCGQIVKHKNRAAKRKKQYPGGSGGAL